ncbi:MAG: lysostaphin resistance A-like protein, partial [Ginsengibacter sp.]
MTIVRSTLITLGIIVILFAFEFLFAFTFSSVISNNQLTANQNITGLYLILPYLITYSLVLIYFKFSKFNFCLTNKTIQIRIKILVFTIFLIVIGNKFVELPFFDWKILFNKYLGTSFVIGNYSDHRYSTSLLYLALNVVIISPFFEECIFRYYMVGGLLKKYNFLTSILTSSILFSLIHISSPRNLIPTFILGFTSAIIYYNTKKIIFSIILHLLYNFLWFIT